MLNVTGLILRGVVTSDVAVGRCLMAGDCWLLPLAGAGEFKVMALDEAGWLKASCVLSRHRCMPSSSLTACE